MTDIVTLTDVKTHLRIPMLNADEDAGLAGFISAANDAIREECGDVIPETYEEFYDGGSKAIWLEHCPLLSVELVEEGWGTQNYVLKYVQVNSPITTETFAYSIDDLSFSEITRRSAGNVIIPFVKGSSNIRVVYTAGRAKVPGSVRLAALELIRHWYTGSQQRSDGSSDPYDAQNTDFTRSQGVSGYNSGIPDACIELLKPYRKNPVQG